METLLLISLVIIIVLLLIDKAKNTRQQNLTKTEELPFQQDNPISIIGESKPIVLKHSLLPTHSIEEFDLEEEENEFSKDLPPIIDEFTQKVTMDELRSFVASIEKEHFNQEDIQTAEKIEGSDLLQLLQQAMPDAAQTIAKLLDQSLSEKTPKKEEVINSEDFNINDFV